MQDTRSRDLSLPSAAEQRQQITSILVETLKQGPKPILQEANLLLEPWGFDLTEVTSPIRIWHGSKDVNAPVSQSRRMAKKLPDARMIEYDLDHVGMLGEIGMVLEEMITDDIRSIGTGS